MINLHIIKEKAKYLWSTQKLLCLGVSLSLFLLLITIIIAFSSYKPSKPNPSPQTLNPISQESTKLDNNPQIKTYPNPSIFFEKYVNKASPPIAYTNLINTLNTDPSQMLNLTNDSNRIQTNNEASINVYSFKTSFSELEVKSFAKYLGLTDVKAASSSDNASDYLISYNFSDTAYDENPQLANDRGILTFNKLTGSFDYQSYGVKLVGNYTKGQDVKLTAMNFLKELKINKTNLADASLSCNITFQRKELPDTTFVECHRDWEKIGLAIYNFIGILNVSENTSLSSLKLGSVDSLSPEDKSVTEVNIDGVKTPAADGKLRPNDFNTVTVAINNTDGRILSVSSNLRWIESEKAQPLANLLTPDEALKQFINHESDLSLTIPSGSGTIDWGKVYQENKAHGKEAVITEYLLSYLETPPSVKQEFLVPMYTIRGYTTLDTGFRVNFIQTVPALKDNTSFLSSGNVLGTSTNLTANTNSSLQIGTYDPANPSPQPSSQQPQAGGGQPANPSSPVNSPAPQPPTNDSSDTGSHDPLSGIDIPIGDPDYFRECGNTAGNLTIAIPNLGTISYQISNTENQDGRMISLRYNSVPISDMNIIRNILRKLVEEQYAYNVIKYVTDKKIPWWTLKSQNDMYDLFRTINTVYADTSTPASNLPLPAPILYSTSNTSPAPANGQDEGSLPGNRVTENLATSPQVAEDVAVNLLRNHNPNQYRNLFPAYMNDVRYFTGYFHIIPFLNTTFGKCYVSGTPISPTLFLYTNKKTLVIIQITQNWIYTNPKNLGNSWSGTIYPNGNFIPTNSRISYDYLYYEYDSSKISFNTPSTGFSVKFNDWENTVKSIAVQFKLNQKETERLILEVKNELYNKPTSNYLTISVINPQELDSKLPLTISPIPNNIHRLHLSLTPSDTYQRLPQPIMNSINRTNFYAIEVGARYEK